MAYETKHDYNYLFKVVLIKYSRVGNSNLLSKFTGNEFAQAQAYQLNLHKAITREKGFPTQPC